MCDKKFLFIRKTQEEDHNCYSYRQLSVPCNLYRTFALSDDVDIFSLEFLQYIYYLLHSSFENQILSTNSPGDFNSVLDTINHNRIGPAKYFCPKSSSLSASYDSFKTKILKVVESKNRHHVY